MLLASYCNNILFEMTGSRIFLFGRQGKRVGKMVTHLLKMTELRWRGRGLKLHFTPSVSGSQCLSPGTTQLPRFSQSMEEIVDE